MSTDYPWTTESFHSPSLCSSVPGDAPVDDRQERLPGFSTAALAQSHVLLIGAGGLGGAIAGGLIRKGLGRLSICDHDVVEMSNLNRQHFYWADIDHPKALRLARHASLEGNMGSLSTGHDVGFHPQSAEQLMTGVNLGICAVDNNRTRALASRLFRQARLPVIFLAVSAGADYGYVFVQECTGACLGCVFPRVASANQAPQPCLPVPGVLDILRVVGGVCLYAVDSLVMNRRRQWNFKSVYLVGDTPDVTDNVAEKPGCLLCLVNRQTVADPSASAAGNGQARSA